MNSSNDRNKICMLNRKPYRDRHGNLRVRIRCCGKREEGCTLQVQPTGQIVKGSKK